MQSSTPYTWSVTIYDEAGQSSQTASSTFETAFLSEADWQAQWIAAPKGVNAKVEINLSAKCRYIRLDVTKLGLPASTDSRYYFPHLLLLMASV